MNELRAPAGRPCGSCPYDPWVPSGVWSAEEYAKLPPYDAAMSVQPTGVFLCHQRNGRLCSGWVGCHGGGDLLAVRIAVIRGVLSGAAAGATLYYRWGVPLFASAAAAARHGLAAINNPGPAAKALARKLLRLRGVTT